MQTLNSNRIFSGIWARLKNSAPETVTSEKIEGWALEKGLTVTSIERKSVGAFHPIDSFLIITPQGSACFPIETIESKEYWDQRNKHQEFVASLWEKLEWFSPLWVSRGDVNKILHDAKHLESSDAIRAFNYHTSTIYTIPFEAICIEQIMGSADCLRDIRPLAREALLAFYAGYKAASIASLIPAIEGAISRILPAEAQSLATMERVNKSIKGAVGYAAELHYGEIWVPSSYKTPEYLFAVDERVFSFETFRRWLQNSFYRNTNEYSGTTNLNRHIFAHGISDEWQKANLSRLIVALATIGVIESWHNQDSSNTLFFPEMNQDSKLLWEQAILHSSTQMIMKLVEEKNYHENGKKVPLMPTDDGVLLRRAVLMEDCIKDLVRPMRDAGWSVEIDDSKASDIFLKAIGKSGTQEIKIALIYSCATENDIYRELAKDCSAILYRGGPYMQNSFAYGIDAYVGPAAGWQPPRVK